MAPTDPVIQATNILRKYMPVIRITIRNARITILIPLKYFDVMDMKPLHKIIPPEFSEVMIVYVMGGEARDANPKNYEK